MRSSIFVSIFLHVAVIVVGIYGLPAIRKPPVLQDIPMVVEIVPIAAITNLSSAPEPPKEPEKKAEVKPPKPPPAPKVKKAPAPTPPLPAPKPEVAVVPPPPEPKPEPKPKAKPKPKVKVKPKPEAKPKPKAPASLAKAKPRRKPKPPDRFASVLKNLERELKRPAPKKKEKPKKQAKKPKTRFEDMIAKSLSRRPTEYDPNEKMSLSEQHAIHNIIRQTMEPCWIIRAGSKNAQNITSVIKVTLRPDGYVSGARLTNKSRLKSDPFSLAAGESALRAVLNPSCQPYKLPVDKYAVWKYLTLTFNPRESLGR